MGGQKRGAKATKNQKYIRGTMIGINWDAPENVNKTAHEIMTEAFTKHCDEAESLNKWGVRLFITKADVYSHYGLVNWEAEPQFGWEDSDSYEGFKFVGTLDTDTPEGQFIVKNYDRSIKVHGFVEINDPQRLAFAVNIA